MITKSFALFWLLTTVLLLTFSSTEAQQPGKIFRIGVLNGGTASSIAGLLETFQRELSKLGWIEGKSITIEYRFAEQKQERLPELAAELVRLKVDLIVVGGFPGAAAAKGATTTIPIVMTNTGDPVGSGLIASLAQPGGNVTGLSGLFTELNGKRLEVLKDAVPNSRRVGLLWSRSAADSRILESQLKELRSAAVALKLRLEEIETQRDTNRLESAFQSAKQKQVDAIMTTGTPFFFQERKRLVEFAGNTGCRLFTTRRNLSMRVVSCPTGWTTTTSIGARPFTSTKS
jgi:putative tryptophan/tyrosine transport system substrate-binding protein